MKLICRGRVVTITIDIANEKFYQTQFSGVSFPHRVLSREAAKKQISGYAKVLYDAMEYLVVSAQSDSEHLIEILNVSNAKEVINNIWKIQEQIKECLTNKNDLRSYKPNDKLVLDDLREKVFLYPFGCLSSDNKIESKSKAEHTPEVADVPA